MGKNGEITYKELRDEDGKLVTNKDLKRLKEAARNKRSQAISVSRSEDSSDDDRSSDSSSSSSDD